MSVHKNHFTMFDDLDYRIIKKLQQNSRQSAKQIATDLKVNDRTVRKRLDRMIEMDIGRFALILDPVKFGYGLSVDIFLEIEKEREEAIIEELLKVTQISYMAFGMDSNELSLEAKFKSTEQLYDFIRNDIPAIKGVKVTKYTLVPRILKSIDEWIPSREEFSG